MHPSIRIGEIFLHHLHKKKYIFFGVVSYRKQKACLSTACGETKERSERSNNQDDTNKPAKMALWRHLSATRARANSKARMGPRGKESHAPRATRFSRLLPCGKKRMRKSFLLLLFVWVGAGSDAANGSPGDCLEPP